MLYNPETLLDKTKINYYIYKNFLNKLTAEDIAYANKSAIKNNLSYIKINDLFEYDTVDFNSVLNMNSKKKINFKTNYPLYKLKNITRFIPGVTYNKTDEAKSKTQNIILTADNITLDNEFTLQKKIYLNKNINTK